QVYARFPTIFWPRLLGCYTHVTFLSVSCIRLFRSMLVRVGPPRSKTLASTESPWSHSPMPTTVTPILAQRLPFSGSSYFWRTAALLSFALALGGSAAHGPIGV